MPQVRLFADQIDRLGRDRQGTLRRAVERYARGEIVVETAKAIQKPSKLPQKRTIAPLAVSRRFDGIDDARLRAILDAHFAHPPRTSREILREYRKWDRICREMLDNLPPYIIERAH